MRHFTPANSIDILTRIVLNILDMLSLLNKTAVNQSREHCINLIVMQICRRRENDMVMLEIRKLHSFLFPKIVALSEIIELSLAYCSFISFPR